MLSITALAALSALAVQGPGGPSFTTYYETDVAGLRLTAEIHGAPGAAFAVMVEPGQGIAPEVLDWAPLDAQGNGRIQAVFHPAVIDTLRQRGMELRFSAVWLDGANLDTGAGNLVLGGSTGTSLLDFDSTIGDDSVMVAGRVINDQWQDIGLAISAENNRLSGPDLGILFDSANPTGGDTDLRTPNPSGFNNNTPLGHLLIIAENSNDGNGDGLIDVPDDEAEGGALRFDFADTATLSSVTLVDIDERPGTELRFYRNGNLTTPDTTLAIDSLGDGSVQTVSFQETDVERFEVFFRGSGAIADMAIDTCPKQLSFDETVTGMPRQLPAGTWMTDQLLAEQGVTIAATNNAPTHPNKAILFDTLNPTGGDTDLRTPNPGAPGNTEPLGMVLIVAENDIDADGDGLVDDPDDEAAGGTLTVEWDQDVTFLSSRVLDVDALEIDYIRLYDAAGTEIFNVLIPDAPDGAVQIIQPNISGVRRAVLELGGSGAWSRIRYCPDN